MATAGWSPALVPSGNLCKGWSGVSLLGFVSVSRLTSPTSLVVPIIGGSPFLTNSQRPAVVRNPVERPKGHTWKLIARQTQSILHYLFVYLSANLKHNPSVRHTGRPMIKRPLSFSHSLVVAAGVNTYIGDNTVVYPVFRASQSPFDDFLCNPELFCRYPPVSVDHTDAIVSPHDCSAFCTATGAHSRLALLCLARLPGFWE